MLAECAQSVFYLLHWLLQDSRNIFPGVNLVRIGLLRVEYNGLIVSLSGGFRHVGLL